MGDCLLCHRHMSIDFVRSNYREFFLVVVVYVAAKATYIRLLHAKICLFFFFWGGGFGSSSVTRGRTHIVLG